MAEAGAWEGIRRHGLLSTTALLDLYGYTDGARVPIESERRPQIVTIRHPESGETAQVRDNKPLRPAFLEACLIDMTPREWYELLNRKVFFWVREERLATLLSARPYRNRAHDVITVDTRKLVAQELANITLAPINTGATLYPSATKRGLATFKTIPDYPIIEYTRWRGRANAIVELAVDHRLTRVERIALRVERRFGADVQAVLWDPEAP